MYTLYSDKPNLFECNIQLEGCSLSQARARLLIESKDNSLIFNGNIDKTGACVIPLKKLKGLISEEGILTLEVIADEMYFNPWHSEYKLKQSRKVTVEVKSPSDKNILYESNKPKVNVTFKNNPPKTTKKIVSETKTTQLSKEDLRRLLRKFRG